MNISIVEGKKDSFSCKTTLITIQSNVSLYHRTMRHVLDDDYYNEVGPEFFKNRNIPEEHYSRDLTHPK